MIGISENEVLTNHELFQLYKTLHYKALKIILKFLF